MDSCCHSSTSKLVIVDDDLATQIRLEAYFSNQQYHVRVASDGAALREVMTDFDPDVILLDINLPGQDGLTLAREIRADNPHIGIILVTSCDDDVNKIVGLEVGADDYVTKPFNPRELLARVKSLLRRTRESHAAKSCSLSDPAGYLFGSWRLNLTTRTLVSAVNQEKASLTRGEFRVLALLIGHCRQVVDREQLSIAISGKEWNPYDRTVDVLIRRLRSKLDRNTAGASLITTVRGEGYRLAVDAQALDAMP